MKQFGTKTSFKKTVDALANHEAMSYDIAVPITKSDVLSIWGRLDGNRPDSSSSDCEEAYYNIYIGCNIWCYSYADLTGHSPLELASRIKLYGLQFCIREANDHRLFLISDGESGTCSTFWTLALPNQKVSAENLTILGFLRRLRIPTLDYSFMFNDYLKSNTKCGNFKDGKVWSDLSVVKTTKAVRDKHGNILSYALTIPKLLKLVSKSEFEREHPNPSKYLLDHIKYYINEIFKDWKQDTSLFTLPPGVTYEGDRNYLDKFKQVVVSQQWLREHGVNLPYVFTMGQTKAPADCNRYTIVPKDYSKGRGVAPEPVARQVLGYQVDAGMRRELRKKTGIDLSDQGLNQEMCRLAYKLKLATVDFSAASDSISFLLVDTLFEDLPLLRAQLKACRTRAIDINGTKYPNFRFATMGNAITFVLETAIFYAMAAVAYDLAVLFKAKGLTKDHKLKRYIFVYGDDVIIPDAVYPIFCEIAEQCGFTVNKDKSYSCSNYKESCGVEYYKGKDVTGVYFPRGTSRKSLHELLGLQHKLVDWPSANNFLIRCLLDVFPDMTTSMVGSTHDDIWSYSPIVRKAGHLSLCTLDAYGIDVFDDVGGSRVGYKLKKDEDYKWFFKPYTTVKRDFRYPRNHVPGKHYCYSLIQGKAYHTVEKIPDEAYGEFHTTIDSRSGGTIPKDLWQIVELLMYLLTLGEGIDHINSSEYTKPTEQVRCRADLVYSRIENVFNKKYFE